MRKNNHVRKKRWKEMKTRRGDGIQTHIHRKKEKTKTEKNKRRQQSRKMRQKPENREKG